MLDSESNLGGGANTDTLENNSTGENVDPGRSVNTKSSEDGLSSAAYHTQTNDNKSKSSVEDNYVLTKLPQRGTPEYMTAFENLPIEEQFKVEEELSLLKSGKAPELEKLYNEKFSEKSAEKSVVNDKDAGKSTESGEQEFKAISKEVFDKLDPEVQTTVKAMHEELTALESRALTPEQKAGFDLALQDPVISRRMEALVAVAEDPSKMKNFVIDYDPNEHVDVEALVNLDFKKNRDESLKVVSEMLKTAARKGYEIADANISLLNKAHLKQVNLKIDVEKQLNEMVIANPSMKSDKAFTDKDHPLAPFFKWVASKGIKPEQLSKDALGVKSVFDMYMSNTGGLQNIIEKQITETRKKMFLDFEKFESEAKNFNKSSRSPIENSNSQMYKGIDLTRYKTDRGYRSRMFGEANFDTQLKLEKYVTSQGKYVPTD